MKKCPSCKNGKITITATEISVSGTKKLDPVTINCIDCNGTGKVSDKKFKEILDYQNAWCTCKTKSMENAVFHENGNVICGKHCYTCSTCAKLLQVG